MKLIFGLGNPGTKYQFTRHNIGFMLIDSLAESPSFQNKHKSLLLKAQISSQAVLLAKPQTYMNLSGQAIYEIVNYYKIPLENILVIQDDKDQNFLSLKFQKTRGDGGHNGIKNIHQELKTNSYARLKLGINSIPDEESQQNHPISTSDFVLSPFSKKEMEHISQFLRRAQEAVLCFLEKGFEEASNQFNQKI